MLSNNLDHACVAFAVGPIFLKCSHLNEHNSGLDPVLGIFTGALAYYLYESNPRTAPPLDQRLSELAQWKWSKWKTARDERLARLEAEAVEG